MKTFYCVTSAVDDSGHITAAITASIEAEKKPENTCCELPTRDVYNDWFSTREEAASFVEIARDA